MVWVVVGPRQQLTFEYSFSLRISSIFRNHLHSPPFLSAQHLLFVTPSFRQIFCHLHILDVATMCILDYVYNQCGCQPRRGEVHSCDDQVNDKSFHRRNGFKGVTKKQRPLPGLCPTCKSKKLAEKFTRKEWMLDMTLSKPAKWVLHYLLHWRVTTRGDWLPSLGPEHRCRTVKANLD